jgi:hypothetical protein
MDMINTEFKVGVIEPVQCMKDGWELIKDEYWLFFGIVFVGMLIGAFIPFGLGLGAMFCGTYYVILKKMDGQPVEFGDLFKGFNYFAQGLIAMLVIVVPAIILSVFMSISVFGVFFASMDKNGVPSETTFFALWGAVLVESVVAAIFFSCLHALIMFAFPLIVDKNLSGWEAFKLSARAVWQNLSGVIGLILVEFALGFVGYLGCGIGLYFTLPIMYAGVLVAYRRVFPKNNTQPLGGSPLPNAFKL